MSHTSGRTRALLLTLITIASGLFAVATAPVASASTPCTSYQYGYGGTGTCVGYIQRILNGSAVNGQTSCSAGGMYYESTSQISVDNSWGPQTNSRVYNFQRSHCLKSDRIVGPRTWFELCVEAADSGYRLSGGNYNPASSRDRILVSAYRAGYNSRCSKFFYYVYYPELL